MSCVICKAQEQDLGDIQQRIAELLIDQKRAMTFAERDAIGLEIRAVAAAKSEYERKQLKHQMVWAH